VRSDIGLDNASEGRMMSQMATLVSMLRGVNVGGHKRLKMSELGKLYESLGFTDVRTYVQTGNVVFSHASQDTKNVARQIEKELRARLNLDITVFVKTPSELSNLVDRNPFKKSEPSRVHVTFLSTKPDKVPTDKIESIRTEGEAIFIHDREVYLFTPNGYGRSKLSNSFFEKTLNLKATTRNWNTVKALLNMAKQVPVGRSTSLE
jgi:uncharacterized protein (DUF1697 family)